MYNTRGACKTTVFLQHICLSYCHIFNFIQPHRYKNALKNEVTKSAEMAASNGFVYYSNSNFILKNNLVMWIITYCLVTVNEFSKKSFNNLLLFGYLQWTDFSLQLTVPFQQNVYKVHPHTIKSIFFSYFSYSHNTV